jgi:SAM-dependent methyltransferase
MAPSKFLGPLHRRVVFDRRAAVLAAQLAPLFPIDGTILDIGCGDGTIDRLILKKRSDLSITGIDVFVWPSSQISVTTFDGKNIPFEDSSFDVAMLIDILHHTEDPNIILQQAKRVARKAIVIKDHFRNGLFSKATLRFMDWMGNAPHGVSLPYNYWSREEWMTAFKALSLEPDEMILRLGLYPMPASMIFERGLHFVARLPIGSQQFCRAGREIQETPRGFKFNRYTQEKKQQDANTKVE